MLYFKVYGDGFVLMLIFEVYGDGYIRVVLIFLVQVLLLLSFVPVLFYNTKRGFYPVLIVRS